MRPALLAVSSAMPLHLPAWSPEELTVEATLGQGGMGVVRLAQQASMGRRVAVKQLKPDHRTPEAQRKLLQEAWAAGCLEHPFIVPVYALGRDECGMPMMVLKHLDGMAWSDQLSGVALSGEVLDGHLQVLEQVAQAVAFAHSRGVLHRDIKPHNVMVGRFGDVTLLDWGLAVALNAGDPRLPRVEENHVLAGTPSYMAPEQLAEDARRCGVGTDVYLLAATFYQLMHGHAPHRGRSVAAILERVRVNQPEIQTDADAAWILRDCLQDDPCKRPEAAEFVSRLAQYRALRGARAVLARTEVDAESMRACLAEEDLAAALRLLNAARFGQDAAMLAGATVTTEERAALFAPVVHYYLEREQGEAALRLLDEHGQPAGPLRERAEAAAQQALENRRALTALAEDRDMLVGVRTRSFVGGMTGLSWVLVPLSVYLYELREGPLSYETLLTGAVATSLVSLGLTTWARESLSLSLANRVAKAVILLASGMAIAALVRGMLLGLPPHEALAVAQMGWIALGAMAAVVLGAELATIAVAHSIGLVVTAFRPDMIWLVIAVCDLVFAYAVLVPYRKALAEANAEARRNREGTELTPD